MKLIKWIITVIIVLIPIIAFWISFYDYNSENTKDSFILWLKCWAWGTIICWFFIEVAEKFRKWFDSKLK